MFRTNCNINITELFAKCGRPRFDDVYGNKRICHFQKRAFMKQKTKFNFFTRKGQGTTKKHVHDLALMYNKYKYAKKENCQILELKCARAP